MVVFVALESEFRIPSARQYLHQLSVNQLVVGSIPTAGAKISERLQGLIGSVFGRTLARFGFLQHLCNMAVCADVMQDLVDIDHVD